MYGLQRSIEDRYNHAPILRHMYSDCMLHDESRSELGSILITVIGNAITTYTTILYHCSTLASTYIHKYTIIYFY